MSATDGKILGVTKIEDNGPGSARYDIVIVAEGYRESEMPKFRTDVSAFLAKLWATPPFTLLRRAFNVHRLEVASTDSGADDPACGGGVAKTARTYFDATFCSSGVDRLLVVNNGLVISTVGAKVPDWNMIMVLVNSTKYGGSGGAVATCSTHPDAAEIAIHESGHTAYGLADEYSYYLGCGVDTDKNLHPAVEPGNANVTVQNTREDIPWADLISPATTVPTMANLNCAVCDVNPCPVPAATVGIFEGAHYYHCRCYRPQFDCKMRNLGQPFCAVCARKIRWDTYPYMFDRPETFRGTWSTGWTSSVPFVLGGFYHLLSYNAGRVSIDRIRANGSGADQIYTATWSLGWTTMMPFVLGGQPHILSYKIASGQVSIDRIRPDGKGTDTLYSDTWTTGWSTFMPFTIAGRQYYLGYKIGTGQVTIDRVKIDGKGVDTMWGGVWTTGWSSFVPFLLQGQPAYIGYKVSTGQMTLDRIRPGGINVDTIFSDTWTQGWTSFVPFSIADDWFYLGYKVGTGQVTVDRIRPAGDGTETALATMWTTGWTTLVPVNIVGIPAYFGYKIASGTAVIGPI